MEYYDKEFCLEVWGPMACFTRPELKVERVSYDVITPSAARGVFSAIFWKPAIRWRITKIEVMTPIRWTSVRRNDVSTVANPRSDGVFIEDARQQRAGLILRDVRYRLYGEFDFIPPEKRSPAVNPSPEWLTDDEENELYRQTKVRPDEKEAKYAAIFERRASKGQYFLHPYLGCREFSCRKIHLVKHPDQATEKPIAETRDLGFMLYDMDYSDLKDIKPMFYRPMMVDGTINVPHPDSEEVFK